MGDVLIASLMIGDCSHSMCVRASRFWDFYDPQDERKLLHTDLVLIDEEGNSIHAQIYPPLNEQFKAMINEDSVYNLKYFLVKKANKFYKPVENSNMINFTKWTTVEEVLEIPPAFPVCTYKLTPIEQIRSRVDYKEYFTDVIGVVTMISNVSTLRTRTRQTESLKRTVTIRSASNVPPLNIVLWGERATSFPAEQVHKDGQTSPQIIIFVGTLVRSYADNVSLSGGSSCKWYINAPVPEVKSLKASVENMHHPVMWDQVSTSTEPSTFVVAEHKKIIDIKYLHPFENKKKEWLVTVKVLKIDKSWWYNSCKKCLKTSKPHGDTYRCTNPNCNGIGAPTPRYKLCITAEDETSNAEFIFFGRIAQRLIKKTVDSLIAANPSGFIPDEITRLLEKVFEWNVSFTENTIASGNVSFQVNAINAEIDDGKALPATPGSQSSSMMLSQGASISIQNTPQKVAGIPLLSPSAASEASHASSATPSKKPLLIHELPLTPQSSKDTSKDETSTQKGKDLTLELADKTTELVAAPTVFERSPAPSEGYVDTIVPKPAAAQTDDTDMPDGSTTKTRKSVASKRTRTSPAKKTAKKLFKSEDDEDDNVDSCTDGATKPSA